MNKELKTSKDFIEYLKKINFQKHLVKLEKKLKNKRIVLYGAGAFFQTIADNYDLSKLNIIAIADKNFISHVEGETFYGYKVCSPEEIIHLNPDMLIISTLYFTSLITTLETTVLLGTKIKIKPLINKPFFEIWKEIWK